jgi:hypothetical protein
MSKHNRERRLQRKIQKLTKKFPESSLEEIRRKAAEQTGLKLNTMYWCGHRFKYKNFQVTYDQAQR